MNLELVIRCALFTPGRYGTWGLPLLFWGSPGCLAANTPIAYESRGPNGVRRSAKGGSIERLYQVFNRKPGAGKGRYQLAPEDSQFFVTSMRDDGTLFKNRVLDVIFSGRKQTFYLRTARGLEVEATADHLFATPDGYKRLDALVVGDVVMTHNNSLRYSGSDEGRPEGRRRTTTVKHHPQGCEATVTQSWGGKDHTYTYKRINTARLVYEAHMNKLPFDAYVARLNDGDLTGLEFVAETDDVHHKNEDFTDDRVENLEVLSHAAHAEEHAAGTLRYVAVEDRIEEIEEAGEQDTYDVSVAAPYHNFVAAGLVVHNCSKTQRIRAVTARCGLPCEVLSPGERGEAAFGVIPVPKKARQGDEEIDVITNPLPEWALPFIEADGRGVVFVDELTTMPPVVAPAGLGLVDERRIGGRFLGPGVRVLAAANPVGEAASGYDLPPPVANRLGHLDWELPSIDEWVAWLMSESADSKAEDPADIEESIVGTAKNPGPWHGAFAKWKGLAAGFLRARTAHDGKSFLFQMPKPNDPNLSRAWPSPRSWELEVRAAAGAEVHGLGDSEEAHALMAAFVGEGAAAEFVAYAREADLPSPEEVLDGKVAFAHEQRRPDRTMAVLASCVALIVPAQAHKRIDRANKLWEILGDLCESDALDLVGLQVKELHKVGLVKGIKAAVPVMHRARPMFVAAGLIS